MFKLRLPCRPSFCLHYVHMEFIFSKKVRFQFLVKTLGISFLSNDFNIISIRKWSTNELNISQLFKQVLRVTILIVGYIFKFLTVTSYLLKYTVNHTFVFFIYVHVLFVFIYSMLNSDRKFD